ncbi:uncharacterized protein A4U43_C07F37310 [Asparagus officinalis]|uniref:Remorin C-terminal domain-containing protein n=1 Tax=Asparagus officinalis TaxID=4686 RepID=A0A5P1EJV0_ASPOF|nr:remorin 4.1-like [Asparagus officinalis]ONK65457.1 uncharacterized protein A4U43_C07F37310 [Asparagus officinalis]
MSHNHRPPLDESDDEIREIHALNSPQPSSSVRGRSPSFTPSVRSNSNEADYFSSVSREFDALVVAGSAMEPIIDPNLVRIREEEEETNPLAIVPDRNPIPPPQREAGGSSNDRGSVVEEEVSVHRVKKEEVEAKIVAWQTAEIAKINNKFKREDVVVNGWESEKVDKANARLKKVERKLEEKRARATEKMQNDAAKARRKAEEKRASAEAKRGVKVAKVLELANLLRAVGRAPSRRSFFF